jgi:hypothetical protein
VLYILLIFLHYVLLNMNCLWTTCYTRPTPPVWLKIVFFMAFGTVPAK